MSSLSFPRIWIPRRNLVTDALHAVMRDPTTGARKRDSATGARWRTTQSSPTCCCATPGCDCNAGTRCNAGTTPATVTLMASGVSWSCSGCYSCNPGGGGAPSIDGASVVTTPPDPNGTFTMPQVAIPTIDCCSWTYQFTANTFCRHSVNSPNSPCPCPSSGNISENTVWTLIKGAGYWYLELGAAGVGTAYDIAAFAGWILTTDPINCNSGTLTFSNQIGACGCFTTALGNTLFGMGTSGTVVVTL